MLLKRHTIAALLSLQLCLFNTLQLIGCTERIYNKAKMLELRERVRRMFQHAYDGYIQHASSYDELRPLTCDGIDTWGSYSLTLCDALDTLASMGNFTEFRRVAQLLEAKMDFDKDLNVSVFETNIRIVGGLLSAHLLSKKAGMQLEPGWPCQGPLLRLAEDIARRLLPAFDTKTGMPYGTVNLRYGVPKAETSVTCTAGIGTFLLEFGTLSRLTGNPIYEEVALNAMYSLWQRRSALGLFGNHIDVQTARWTALDSGIGAGVDSYFEYMVKAALLLDRPDLLEMFHEARASIDKYLKREDWYVWVGMNKGQITLPVFQSLEAYWPGLLSLVGDVSTAKRIVKKYSSVWRKYGFLPEFFNIATGEASQNRASYPLRPELAESLMYLYRATKDPFLLEVGEDMIESIEHSAKTKCGYATIRNVLTHEKENRMESFFLSETTKYLYLLFDEENFLHNNAGSGDLVQTPEGTCLVQTGPYIFNTEAHPIDVSTLHCCHNAQDDIFDALDLTAFNDAALLKEEQRRSQDQAEKLNKYKCTTGTERKHAQSPVQTQSKVDSNLSVEIEVFDENNIPAADMLIQNFEQIRQEQQQQQQQHVAANETQQLAKRNQLTVNDLTDFFKLQRNDFEQPQQVLDYVRQFMQKYTLDAAFISGLQLLDKNITATLGMNVQREYESRLRTLWELYDLQQQYLANMGLLAKLHLLPGDGNETTLSLDVLLQALNSNGSVKSETNMTTNMQDLLLKIKEFRLKYEQSIVNTTAMQQFLLKILINGTTEKQRTLMPLLNDTEVHTLHVPELNATQSYELFAITRRIVELKQRILDTFNRLQTLMQESSVNKSSTITQQAATATATSAEFEKASTNNAITVETTTAATPSSVDNSAIAETNNDSVWAQLVQTILRKTSTQPIKFDEQLLLQKTRQSMQEYAALQKTNQKYELFTCQRENYINKFLTCEYDCRI